MLGCKLVWQLQALGRVFAQYVRGIHVVKQYVARMFGGDRLSSTALHAAITSRRGQDTQPTMLYERMLLLRSRRVYLLCWFCHLVLQIMYMRVL